VTRGRGKRGKRRGRKEGREGGGERESRRR